MKITFNGTGASEGFPALFCECEHCTEVRTMDPINFRMRSSCLIDESLLVDFSSDTYARCLYGKLDLTQVKDIIFTHSHSDHFYPEDLGKIAPPFGLHNRKEPLRIYGNRNIGQALEDMGMTGPDKSPYLRFSPMVAFETYHIANYKVTPLPANHDPSQECFIYVIQGDDKTLLYGHDSGYFGEETWAGLKNFKFDGVILDCTAVDEECPYPSHMGLPDNIRVRERMYNGGAADGQTTFIITHFAHTNGPFYEYLNGLARETGFIAAYDGLEIIL
ncbi:MAG TPA: MBL fold metallo-hydrolase [Clostridia bacterium]|nr:MBL fold metallo-hydrolase [Clostridia bacterium]